MEPRPHETVEHTLAPRPNAAAALRDGANYLLVLVGGTSLVHYLPADGGLLIGRGRDAELRLDHPSVSRRQATLQLAAGEALLVDLGSRNGTQVNGVRLAAPRSLVSGDVIAIGEVTLVFHRSLRAAPRRGLVDPSLLRQRLDEEIARALHYRRPLAVVHVQLEPGDQTRHAQLGERLHDLLRAVDSMGRDTAGHLVVLLPELDGQQARHMAEAILRSLLALVAGARAGVAVCPDDGCDADALLAGGRAAAMAAKPGQLCGAAAAATTIQIGEHTLVAAEPAVVRLFELIARLAPSELPLLITGETGSGKELAAAAVHHGSPRRSGPFVAINCAALPDSLIESELFGHEKGAFSGAVATKPGRLEAAAGGTVFLDEVGELTLGAQAKLLRALETKRITRLGAARERSVDIRLVAATNRDLDVEIAAGRFRQDLLFRLAAATVMLPPLRDRPRDLPLLSRLFLERACGRLGRPPLALSPATMQALGAYRWPGNIRELRNLMDYLAAAVTDPVVEPHALPAVIGGATPPPAMTPVLRPPPPDPVAPSAVVGHRLSDEVRALERSRIQSALETTAGNQSRAAELIGMPRRTFVTKMKDYGLWHRTRGRF